MEITKVITYRSKKATSAKTFIIPDSVKQKLSGIILVALGVLSAIVCEENDCYDITATLLLVPIGLIIVFGKCE